MSAGLPFPLDKVDLMTFLRAMTEGMVMSSDYPRPSCPFPLSTYPHCLACLMALQTKDSSVGPTPAQLYDRLSLALAVSMGSDRRHDHDGALLTFNLAVLSRYLSRSTIYLPPPLSLPPPPAPSHPTLDPPTPSLARIVAIERAGKPGLAAQEEGKKKDAEGTMDGVLLKAGVVRRVLTLLAESVSGTMKLSPTEVTDALTVLIHFAIFESSASFARYLIHSNHLLSLLTVLLSRYVSHFLVVHQILSLFLATLRSATAVDLPAEVLLTRCGLLFRRAFEYARVAAPGGSPSAIRSAASRGSIPPLPFSHDMAAWTALERNLSEQVHGEDGANVISQAKAIEGLQLPGSGVLGVDLNDNSKDETDLDSTAIARRWCGRLVGLGLDVVLQVIVRLSGNPVNLASLVEQNSDLVPALVGILRPTGADEYSVGTAGTDNRVVKTSETSLRFRLVAAQALACLTRPSPHFLAAAADFSRVTAGGRGVLGAPLIEHVAALALLHSPEVLSGVMAALKWWRGLDADAVSYYCFKDEATSDSEGFVGGGHESGAGGASALSTVNAWPATTIKNLCRACTPGKMGRYFVDMAILGAALADVVANICAVDPDAVEKAGLLKEMGEAASVTLNFYSSGKGGNVRRLQGIEKKRDGMRESWMLAMVSVGWTAEVVTREAGSLRWVPLPTKPAAASGHLKSVNNGNGSSAPYKQAALTPTSPPPVTLVGVPAGETLRMLSVKDISQQTFQAYTYHRAPPMLDSALLALARWSAAWTVGDDDDLTNPRLKAFYDMYGEVCKDRAKHARDEGNLCNGIKEWSQAIWWYTLSLNLQRYIPNATSVNASFFNTIAAQQLVSRAQCYSKLGMMEHAWLDAVTAGAIHIRNDNDEPIEDEKVLGEVLERAAAAAEAGRDGEDDILRDLAAIIKDVKRQVPGLAELGPHLVRIRTYQYYR
ncbi:hypothetical protein HDU93_008443 [Gonapodya sp. JEL0774]|nr:hypothetical protein HDU93_008443 [Gonapodya sp. JEL0774]